MGKTVIAKDKHIDALEQRLRISHQWLMTTLNKVGDAVIALDTHDKLTFMNQAAEALTGWQQSDAVGEKLCKILNVDGDASAKKSVQNYIRKMKSEGKIIRTRGNNVLNTKNSSELPVFDCRIPVGEENILGTVLILQDITARKKAEKELREGIERFESLYDNVTLGVFRIAADGHVIMANQAMAEIFGFKTPKELSDYNILDDGITPAFMSGEYSKQIKETGEIRNIESTLIRRDGSKIQIRESAQAISDSFGNIIYYEGTIEDITDWKKAEDDFRESEAHFRGILKHSKAGYFFTDSKGKIVDVNEAWLTLHKYDSLKEVKGKHYYTTMLDEDIEAAKKQEAKLREGKSIPAGEARRLCRDGSVGYHTYTINPVKRANIIIGFEGFIIDNTVQKSMDKKRRSLEFKIQ